MSTISLNHVEMYYEIKGKGPPLLLIGGLANDHTLWDPLVEFLENFFTVITFDNRGMGKTLYPDSPFTIKDMADDALDLLEHLHMDKVFLVGFSLGGAIAQEMASKSDKILKAIFIATATEFSEVAKMTARFQYFLRRTIHEVSYLLLGFLPWLFSSHFLSQPEIVQKIVEKTYQDFDEKTLIGYERQVQALEKFQGKQTASLIKVPALVIGADEDILVLIKQVQQLHEVLPHSTLKILSNSGHMVIFEKGQEICEQILAFCK